MHKLKKLLKSLLPKTVRQPILNFYHLLVAVAANLRYGFPARGLKVIMITGTNGKTSTATLIAGMLEHAGRNVGVNTTAFYRYGGQTVNKKSSRTLEDIFVLQNMLASMKKAGCEYIVLEATSQGLDQNRLWGIPCEVAIMTNLTQDHLDYHGTMERYAQAKFRLFERRPKFIILNRDDQWFDFFNRSRAVERKLNYGQYKSADARITNVKLQPNGSDCALVVDDKTLNLHTRLAGTFNVYNAVAAALAGYVLGLSNEEILAGVDSVAAVPGRLERVDEGQPFDVVVDYAHTPDALEKVLSAMRHLTTGKLMLVFGATGDRDRGKRPIMGETASTYADRLFVTDEETYSEDGAAIRAAIIEGIKKAGGQSKVTEIADRREAIAAAFKEAKKGDSVIITGLGHELTRNMGGKAIDWNDSDIARTLLKN
ncbi:MAG TPA: UDP-N-acetylmuramoyl-L-alanyl-D-glutamate--2,6-diaminopimelate ligase [Candidatus Pristimantibacillus sp.]|nr:UDP-N-acetylmuramoyl-L-alanyl-D-glutamate--2,6-diaminopimelate ligase [Candidatus Pristimantibacillus sp.]